MSKLEDRVKLLEEMMSNNIREKENRLKDKKSNIGLLSNKVDTLEVVLDEIEDRLEDTSLKVDEALELIKLIVDSKTDEDAKENITKVRNYFNEQMTAFGFSLEEKE